MAEILAKDFLNVLIECSERAARISRRCRLDGSLFPLLVEEKEGSDRFVQDFKTFADVLVQQTIKFHIEKSYPELRQNIYGEENNEVRSIDGKKVTLNITSSKEETSESLEQALGAERRKFLSCLLDDIFGPAETNVQALEVPDILKLQDVGIWIDPIDATNEYVQGSEGIPSEVPGAYRSGLPCVTILIGVFSTVTHEPLIGVVNQPFIGAPEDGYCSKIWWGLSIGGTKVNNLPNIHLNSPAKAAISSSERPEIRKSLSDTFQLVEMAGAGYKILCTALGLTDAFVLSKSTTYKYDTCAPHALLLSQGGNLVELDGILDEKANSDTVDMQGYQVTYFSKTEKPYKNVHGLIGFVEGSILLDVVDLLS
ncbi:inositol polyphosphate 1-phosphatase-like [Artemia franciscana]|uniref:Inositol polyphosphate 1-phosphatase n=1 Tax=Artemia franciscana TaxID=6661 RepID=A0AA88KXK2_ARTSF|nr:hypothetical protein QYM36_016084 [Artemia franciscana]